MHVAKRRMHVKADGVLRLEILVPYREADVDVVIHWQQVDESEQVAKPEDLGWPLGFFEQTAGKWAGERLVREK